ncbi:MAG: L,D-transpeptidase family protein [Ignavibacteria bacterium]|nr:L,D-transpeptidase family protein [Ignavibacteria bacterium]
MIFLFACNKTEYVEQSLNEKLKFNSADYQNAIRELFVNNDSLFAQQDTLIENFDTLKYFYSKRDFKPLFIKSFEEKGLLYSFLITFKNAEEHGLNPEAYHYGWISEEYLKAIKDTSNTASSHSNLAKVELLACDAILKYSYHLRYGVLNPKETFNNSYYLPITDIKERNLFEPLQKDSIISYLQKIQPKSERYIKLQSSLKHFKKYLNSDWKKIPISKEKLEVGDEDSSLFLIVDRLSTLGFLDTSKIKINSFSIYDSLIAVSVKYFQRIHGLNDDGVIGNNTIKRLNTTPQEYVERIKINLERFRWIDYPDTLKYILVNIPDFRLYVRENGKTKFGSKVCTGRKRPSNYEKRYKYYKKTKNWRDKPDDWETPNMYGEISYLVLNPTWNVPTSIMREEIATKVENDSSYLESRNFKVYIDTLEINLAEFDINELYADTIPYKIVQDPGAGNALGKIKFMFYNPFGIYLHDTPTRRPFSYSNRAVSHGCVRVEKPLQLAEFLLHNHPKWNIDFLKIEIGQRIKDKSKFAEYNRKRSSLRKYSKNKKTTELVLSDKMPLYIDYYTAWVDENGITNFREDVYGRDEVLSEKLFF